MKSVKEDGKNRVYQRIDSVFLKHSDKEAIKWGNKSYSYLEIEQLASQLSILGQKIKTKPVVLIHDHSCPGIIVALISVVKSDGIFVLCEETLPIETFAQKSKETLRDYERLIIH